MAFTGSLFSIKGDAFPLKYIYKESYTAQREILDLDTTRSTTGKLQRNVLDHESFVIAFQTRPMWNTAHANMWEFINNRLANSKARKCNLTFYVPELDDYDSGTFYIPTPVIPIHVVDTDNNKILYNSYEIQFIKY